MRPDGRVGFRNTMLVVPVAGCAKETARRIAAQGDGAIALDNAFGCEVGGKHLDGLAVQIRGLTCSPNVGGVLFLLMGCAATLALKLPQAAKAAGKLVETLNVQAVGSTSNCVSKGVEILENMAAELAKQERVPVGMDSLVIGLKCGASDKLSASELHPLVGLAVDRLVDEGATVALGEICELTECPDDIIARAETPAVAKSVERSIQHWTATIEQIFGVTLELNEEVRTAALGRAAKAGTRPIRKVVDWKDQVTGPGLVLYDGPNSDLTCVTTMQAAGCNLVLFTTGRGTPVCGPVTPTIKLTGTAKTAERMPENIDVNLAGMYESETTKSVAVQKIVDEVLAVANGKQTKGEILGHHEMLFYFEGVMA